MFYRIIPSPILWLQIPNLILVDIVIATISNNFSLKVEIGKDKSVHSNQTKKKKHVTDASNALGMNHLGRCDSLGYGKELLSDSHWFGCSHTGPLITLVCLFSFEKYFSWLWLFRFAWEWGCMGLLKADIVHVLSNASCPP